MLEVIEDEQDFFLRQVVSNRLRQALVSPFPHPQHSRCCQGHLRRISNRFEGDQIDAIPIPMAEKLPNFDCQTSFADAYRACQSMYPYIFTVHTINNRRQLFSSSNQRGNRCRENAG